MSSSRAARGQPERDKRQAAKMKPADPAALDAANRRAVAELVERYPDTAADLAPLIDQDRRPH